MAHRTHEIREFILLECIDSPDHLAQLVSNRFSISRQAAHVHIKRLVDEGSIRSYGETKGRRYALQYDAIYGHTFELSGELQEDQVFHEHVAPFTNTLPDNAQNILYYGFTEMFNNAIDHSEGQLVYIRIDKTDIGFQIVIADDGVGIFEKLTRELHLEDKRHALIELTKGKVTTDPENHTGEGIFFTSKACDKFFIISEDLTFAKDNAERHCLFTQQEPPRRGTAVYIEVTRTNTRTMDQVYSQFTTDHAFDITSVPVKKMEVGNAPVVSRSQGKRLVAGLERFRVIYVDFSEVHTIGQAFADEVFRVFAKANPNLQVVAINTNLAVRRIIARVTGEFETPEPSSTWLE